MIILFHAPVTGTNTLLSKKSAWKITDLWTENLLDPVLNYTEWGMCDTCAPLIPVYINVLLWKGIPNSHTIYIHMQASAILNCMQQIQRHVDSHELRPPLLGCYERTFIEQNILLFAE